MAARPVFIPAHKVGRLVEERSVAFQWHRGMAPSQKKKNVAELHGAAAKECLFPLLEVSTKSEEKLGQRLSAFNLKIDLYDGRRASLESVFQSSKVFERGGPFSDLLDVEAVKAKRDERLTNSGGLVGFRYEGRDFPLIPKTAFYDWLYIRALYPHRVFLQCLNRYQGFTDIEFNPEKSINCQARSCATFVSLNSLSLLDECVESSERFILVLLQNSIEQPYSYEARQQSLLD